jgi:hypothetical protein
MRCKWRWSRLGAAGSRCLPSRYGELREGTPLATRLFLERVENGVIPPSLRVGGMHYIITNGGIDTEADYPYVAHDDKCSKKKEGRCAASLGIRNPTLRPGRSSDLRCGLRSA